MATIVPTRLRCNLLFDPLVIADAHPRLSWVLEQADPQARNTKQSAYQITVSSSESGDTDLWDSERTESTSTIDILYAGAKLEPFQTAFWRVRVWDESGHESEWSHLAQWTQAPSEWPAKWIGNDSRLERDRPIDLEGANWIWHVGDEPMKSPPGVCFFRVEFDLLADAEIEIIASADDTFSLEVDGDEVCNSDKDLHSWSRPQRCKVELQKGKHEIKAEVENKNLGAGAFIAKVRTANSQTVTDATWQARKHDDKEWTSCQNLIEYGGAPWGKLREAESFLPPPPDFYKTFTINRPVKRALIYATALGLHYMFVNRQHAQQDWFAPGWTDYDKRLHYRAYDVTDLLVAGENTLHASLRDGWYAGYVGFKPERHLYGEKTRVSAFLRIEFEDGGQQTVITDDSWTPGIGGTVQSDFLMGEVCVSGEAALQDMVAENKSINLEPYPMDPVLAYELLPAKSVRSTKSGSIFDLGQNFAGVSELKLDWLDQDATVTLTHAEVLDSDGSIYTENMRSAKPVDIVQGRGGPIAWSPKGTYHGFRYVHLQGVENPPLSAVTGIALSNITKSAAFFECSDARLNKLWKNIEWTQRSNFIEVPTDCPQRDERLGWTGDIQMYARTAAIIADVQAFLRKWLVDLSDAQRDDGQYPMVAPLKVAGDDGGPAWSEAGVIVPWALYQVYEDKEILERQWDSMVRFMDFCESRSKDGSAPEEFHCFGDWLNVDAETPNEVIFTAYFAHSANLMAKIAEVLGKSDLHYRQLFETAQKTFIDTFVNGDGAVKGDTQTCYVLALAFDLLDQPLKNKAAEELVKNVEKHGHLTTGFVGTKDLMLVLRDIGRSDLAYKLLLSDEYPGWLFSVKHGATSIWERWNGWTPEDGFADPGMNSFSHYAYGAVGQFMFETIAGIRPLEPGYNKILIAPEPGPLTSCMAGHNSVRGRIGVSWSQEEGEFSLAVAVPPNTTAVVRLPSGEEKTVGSGEWEFLERY